MGVCTDAGGNRSVSRGPSASSTAAGAGGAGLFLLLEPTSSLLEAELLYRVLNLYPAARVHFDAPLAASNDLFVPQYDFREADAIVAVDADFLAAGPFHLGHARRFAERRMPESAGSGMNRCYAIESSVTATGPAADHRLRVRQAEIVPVLQRVLAAVNGHSAAEVNGVDARWIDALARDLRAHPGRAALVGGEYLSAGAKTLVMQVNERLGNIGRTVHRPLMRTRASLTETTRAAQRAPSRTGRCGSLSVKRFAACPAGRM